MPTCKPDLQVQFCKCGEPHDGWPGDDGGELCQMCWEAQCDRSWWEYMRRLDEVLGPIAKETPDGR